ncbi:hypothetical protein PTI98_012076 [Pleurotus ostreatus]|nr:hypothetical protein PTI98_012076 [Pleurotus ostreatus]
MQCISLFYLLTDDNDDGSIDARLAYIPRSTDKSDVLSSTFTLAASSLMKMKPIDHHVTSASTTFPHAIDGSIRLSHPTARPMMMLKHINTAHFGL